MNAHLNTSRWLVAGLLATTVLSLATPALAGTRYKGVTVVPTTQRVVVRERSSDVGPVFAGMVGGFLLGAALTSHSHPVVVHERYVHQPVTVVRYYDPYSDVWFDSLDECDFRWHRRHPRIVYVIDTHSGRHLRTLRFRDGRWHRYYG